jgi:UDP-N-acetylmuramoylalanine--D-glutamate ligase
MTRPGQRCLGFSLSRADADFRLLARDGRDWLAAGGEALMPIDALRLPGRHNAANALAALAVGTACGLPRAAMTEVLARFEGLPHRSQLVVEACGLRWIDDSKGTNVGATQAAIEGLPGPLVLIAGGEGKGQDFAPLAEACRGKVKAAVLIGRDARAIGAAIAAGTTVHYANSMEAAVASAARLAQPGDTVLLSPACASFDMFRDYAERGDVFAAAARGQAQ